MNKYLKLMQSRVDSKRFQHSLAVAETAQKLAQIHGLNTDEAYLAGLVHDYGKDLKAGELLGIAEKHRLIVSEVERQEPFLLHGPAGAHLLQEEAGINNLDILEAVRYHTTGRPGLNKLGLIIYLADLIEPQRKLPGVETIRQLATEDLEQATMAGLDHTLSYLIEQKKLIHPLSIATRNWLLKIN